MGWILPAAYERSRATDSTLIRDEAQDHRGYRRLCILIWSQCRGLGKREAIRFCFGKEAGLIRKPWRALIRRLPVGEHARERLALHHRTDNLDIVVP